MTAPPFPEVDSARTGPFPPRRVDPVVLLIALAIVVGGVVAWKATSPIVIASPRGTSEALPTRSAPSATAGVLIVVIATQPPTAIPEPTPTLTPYTRCRPESGTPTPRIGQSCFNAVPTTMPVRMTATIEPTCPPLSATPKAGSWCMVTEASK